MRYLGTFFVGVAIAALGCGDDAGGMGADAMVAEDAAADGAMTDGGSDGGLVSMERYGKRSDVAGVADPGTNTIVLFGGDDGPIVNQRPRAEFLGDTWVFEPGIGWSEVETDSAPSRRSRYAVAYDSDAGRMLLFGGRFRDADSGPYTLHDDLWAFDFESQTWERLHDGSGSAPAARFSPGMAYDAGSDTLYVAGGGLNENALRPEPAGDLWAFDGDEWSEVDVGGDAPSARLYEGWMHDPSRNRLVAFGGQVGDFITPSYNDMYALDLETGQWSQLDEGTGPTGRFYSMLEYDADGDRYLVFGGHADPGVENDMWAFDPESSEWTELHAGDSFTGGELGCMGNPREIPKGYVDQDLDAPERRQGGFLEILDGRVWLIGGESGCSDHLDDTWVFDRDGNSWAEVLEARSGESCARRGDDCTCLCL